MEKKTVTFYFESRELRGIEGESVAKALFDSGVRTLSLSVKYRRPRGLLCARGRCVACHMSIDGVPGVPTCVTPLRAGMEIERESYQPFYGPLLTGVARVIPFPAGFYYRMFTRPALARKLFLGTLRRMAGVGRIVSGRAALRVDASRTGRATPHALERPAPGAAPRVKPAIESSYDLVVVGCGLTGMSAALSAAHHGLNVLLVDEYDFPAGHSFGYQSDGELVSVRDSLVDKIKRHVAVTYLPGTTAQGFYPPDTLLLGPGGSAGLGAREAMTRVRARSFVFATGANDAVPLFENNDTPGIFGERAIRLLLERDHLRPGNRAVIYGTGAAMSATGELLHHHGIEIAAMVDPTGEALVPRPGGPGFGDVRTIPDARIARARGGAWLRGVEVSTPEGGRTNLSCDLLCVALPGQPAYELAYQAGIVFALSRARVDEMRIMRPVTNRGAAEDGSVSYFVAGGAAGETDWREKIENGERAGAAAARAVRA
jgi:sarcosine oxidase subunit alpha